jgi:hypothetical protein
LVVRFTDVLRILVSTARAARLLSGLYRFRQCPRGAIALPAANS